MKKSNFLSVIASLFAMAIPVLVLTFLFSFRTVGAGHVKVVTQFGRTTGRVLEPGAHFIAPFIQGTKQYSTKKVTYEVTSSEKQKESDADYKDYPVDTNTADGQPVDVYYTIRFSVDPTKANWVLQNIGTEDALVEKIVKTESRVWARNIPRRYNAETLYQGEGTEQVQNEIFERLQPIFSSNGLILDSVGVRELAFTEEFINAIKEKQVAAVRIETEKNHAEAAKYEKEKTITQAQAEAEAQRLQRETLDSAVLEKLTLEVEKVKAEAMKISAEKGQKVVPDTIVGSGSNILYTLD